MGDEPTRVEPLFDRPGHPDEVLSLRHSAMLVLLFPRKMISNCVDIKDTG